MNKEKKNIVIAMLALIVLLAIAYFGMGNSVKGVRQMRYGIDIRGGVEAVFVPDLTDRAASEEELESARNIMESRLDDLNIDDREVTIDKDNGYIIVRFPWTSDEKSFDPEAAISELGNMAELKFEDADGNVLLQGKDIESSSPEKQTQNGISEYVVELEFTKDGTQKFADATSELIGQNMGIYMDDTLISNPRVESAIDGGQAVITGMKDYAEAKELSDKINSGALPFSMKTTNFSTISPSLGQNALTVMIYAGLIAFAGVCIFMLIVYKLPGFIACLTLMIQMTLQLLAISVPQYTLTLPGIAGIILSLGMAVDANIIISERISEEISKGETVKNAIKTGYSKAFTSVLDGNITTAIVAVILMMFGSGSMLSFGYTLLIGMILNCFVGVQLSKMMLKSVVSYNMWNSSEWFRLKKKHDDYRFFEHKRFCLIISGTLIIVGILGICVRGVHLDTQFTGGTVLEYSINSEVNAANIEALVEKETDRPVTVQIADKKADGSKTLVVTLAGNTGLSPDQQSSITSAIGQTLGTDDLQTLSSYAVEPYIGALALRNALIAVISSFVCITLYVWIRFRSMGGLSAGIMALIALLHDVAIVFFTFVLFGIPIGDSFVAVVLTIIGYSINDTIVVYDRIRENNTAEGISTIEQLVDRSVTQVLSRSVNTSLTTAMCVLVILVASVLFDINSIFRFSLPMLLGLISGCYSSICIASALWASWEKRTQQIKTIE